jgi:hypothetical protein
MVDITLISPAASSMAFSELSPCNFLFRQGAGDGVPFLLVHANGDAGVNNLNILADVK